MRYNVQNSPEYGSDIMTQKDGVWIDYLRDWGCLVVSLANILQKRIGKEYTPKALNELLRTHRGYWYLSGKTKEEKNASFLDWDVICDIFNFSVGVNKNYTIADNTYYIARITIAGGGHYINVIEKVGDFYLCFDVLTGYLKYIEKKDITLFLKLVFRS